MGQSNPYCKGSKFFDANVFDNDIEEDTDEDLSGDEMGQDRIVEFVRDMVSQIADHSYEIECALINLRQIRHTYTIETEQFIEAIYPSVLEHIGSLLVE